MSKPVQFEADQIAFLEGLVASGRYASTDDAVVQGLKLLQAREARLTELRQAWREGVNSGGYEPIDAVLDELTELYAGRLDADA